MIPPMRRARPLLLVLAVAALCGGGCYRRVVGVSGPASQSMDISEANIREGESFWDSEKPKPVETDRYSGGTVDRARTLPSKPASKSGD